VILKPFRRGERVLPLRLKLLTVSRHLRKEQNAFCSMHAPLSFCSFSSSSQFQSGQRDDREQDAQNVKPHHHLRFIPALLFEVVVQRRH
jgi:hypothetical protein